MHTSGLGLFERAFPYSRYFGSCTSGKRSSHSPSSSRLHESIGDTDGDIKVGNLIFVVLAGNEIFHIGMIHTQDGHVCATPCPALRDLTEGVVVHAQESDRSGCLPGGGQTPPMLVGRKRENENPFPPPVCWINAASRRVWKMPALSRPYRR